MKKIILPIMAIFLLTQACIRDRGNYVYRDINQFEFIGFEGLDSTIGLASSTPYNVEDALQAITLIPRLATSMDTEEDLVFTWLNDSAGTRVIVHQGRNLENFIVPTRWGGPTMLIFRIRDTVSQKILDTRVHLNVVNPFRFGYLVLQEDAQGYVRLDMLSWLPGVGYRHMTDVLADKGFPRQQGARQIRHFHDPVRGAAFGGRSIYIVTDEPDVYRIHPVTFEWVGEQGHLRNAFLSQTHFPSNSRVDNIVTVGDLSMALINMEGSLFFQAEASARFFSIKLNRTIDGRFFSASPHISAGAAQRFLIFDDDSKSFYRLDPIPDNWVREIPARTDSLVSLRNMNMDLVFSQSAALPVGNIGASGAEVLSYNILKDANGDFWVLRIVLGTMEQQFWQRMNVVSGFNENSIIAVGGEFIDRQIYYAVGGNVYLYNIHNNQSTRVLTLPGEVITYMNFVGNMRHHGPTDGTMGFDGFRFIVIGSFNETTGVGTLTHYRIPEGTGTWTIYRDSRTNQFHQWTDFGLIRDVASRN